MSVYVFSDTHGRYDLFLKMKEFLKEDDIVYCLGDCGDRGPDGWKIIEEVYNDPRMKYIKGNHEDMLVKTMKDYAHYPLEERDNFWGWNYHILLGNGGGSTFDAWTQTPHRFTWIEKLDALPIQLEYINTSGTKIILTHAGITPYEGGEWDDTDRIWDRRHVNDDEDFGEWMKNTIVIHGHTPIPLMNDVLYPYDIVKREDWNHAFWYADKRKVDIDTGAYFTGYLLLLDLDTFEEHLFFDETEVKEKEKEWVE